MKIRGSVLKIYKDLHTWVGICSGILLFIGFFAGAVSMFEPQIDEWTHPPQTILAHNNIQQMDKLVPQVLAQFPQTQKQFTLNLGEGPAPLTWPESGGRLLNLSATHHYAGLNDKGDVVAQTRQPSQLAELVDMLHRTAGIPGTYEGHHYVGVTLMGIASVLYFLALVSGLILLLPTLVKDFFKLRQKQSKKRFWLDAHNLVGITSLPFHIVISLTVIVFAFHDEMYDGLEALVYKEQPMFSRTPPAQTAYHYTDMLTPSQLLEKVQQAAPGSQVQELLFSNLNSKSPMLRAGISTEQHYTRGSTLGYLLIHPYSGEVLNTSMLPGKEGTWGALINFFFALHFGSYGGLTIKWVYFALGLGGAFLFYSGNLLWLESRRKKQLPASQQKLSSRIMAALTVGSCLGSVAGLGFSMLANKWLNSYLSESINYWHMGCYYLVFLAFVAWTFYRGVARASDELLRVSALIAFAFPLTSVLSFIPTLGLWAPNSMADYVIDMVAVAFGLVMLWGAKRARWRAQQDNPDSIWAIETSLTQKQMPA